MHEIGRIKLLQVQQSRLKVKQQPYGYYDPTLLLTVKSLLLSPDGVIGVTTDGRQVIDVHHVEHPASRNHKGVNGVSVGFTSHYEAMRSKFGDHVADGCAGENILVEAENILRLADLGKRLVIQMQNTGELIYLTRLKVAAPCVEFSLFVASHGMALPANQLKETLQFLDGGKRGFYATAEGQSDEMLVRTGDRVFVDDREQISSYSP